METTNNEIIELELDLAWDDTNPDENLGTLLAEMSDVAPSAFVRIDILNGPAGGWPAATVRVSRDEAGKLLECLGFDEYSIEETLQECA